jgi:2-polyprenyl-3-methyl-5-hydroxy-6-metoxy-1,4-benzoquinol methylase
VSSAAIDRATVDYFDSHCHEYGRDRIRGVARMLAPYVGPEARMIDVGCGTGANLARLSRALGITDLTALDASEASLERVRERLPDAQTHCMSLLDEESLAVLQGEYDVVLMAAVLHHLVGRSRQESRRRAQAGLRMAATLARPGGLVVVMEPVFTPVPPWGVLLAPSDTLFWVKRMTTLVTSDRVPLGGYWNNIGAPVVSFYTAGEVGSMMIRSGLQPLVRRIRRGSVGWMDRVIDRGDATFVAQVPGGEPITPRGSRRPRRGGRTRR